MQQYLHKKPTHLDEKVQNIGTLISKCNNKYQASKIGNINSLSRYLKFWKPLIVIAGYINLRFM